MKKHLLASLICLPALTACMPIPIPIPVAMPVTMSTNSARSFQALPPQAPTYASFDKTLNDLRARNGSRPVASSSGLNRVAATHAGNLRRRGVLTHTGVNGGKASDRVRAAGVSRCLAGENLAKGYDTAQGAFQGWLSSPTHRRNMVDRKYANYGIGRSGDVWVMVMLLPC